MIATYTKPVISLVNGYFMGGGAALALHSLFTIISENAVFSMPEVSVHYYPDVLVSWYLTRIPNNIGTYLGLTGCSLNYLELFYCKLAQYFCSKNDVNSLIHELTNHNFENKNDNALLKTQLSKVFEKYHYKLSNNDNLKVKIANEIVKFEPMINQCFKYNTLEMILDALRNESSKNMAHANNNAIGQWCLKTYDQLMNLSPLSLKLTLRLLAVAKHETIAEHAQTCFKVGTKLLTIENFCKGIIYRLGPNKDRSGKKTKRNLSLWYYSRKYVIVKQCYKCNF
jgi:3-hydroxyisobutyryl-CoA hydrolase